MCYIWGLTDAVQGDYDTVKFDYLAYSSLKLKKLHFFSVFGPC